jgi:hypothetical protein
MLSDLYDSLQKLRRVTSVDIIRVSDYNNLVDTVNLFFECLNELGAHAAIPNISKVSSLRKITTAQHNDLRAAIFQLFDTFGHLGLYVGSPSIRTVKVLDIKSSGDHNSLVDSMNMAYLMARDLLKPPPSGGLVFLLTTFLASLRRPWSALGYLIFCQTVCPDFA